jgi:U3 small nucleolar RNA-associated protein 12
METETTTTTTDLVTTNDIEIEQTVQDEFTRICLLKTKHKIKYVDLLVNNNKQNDTNTCLVSVLLTNNQFEIYSLDLKIRAINDESNLQLLHTIESGGHRTDVRTISFSSDSTAFLTASGDCLKVWNRLSLSCIRTLKCDYALCSAFLPDDNHVLIGCKSGKIQLFDINSAKLLENVSAHTDNSEVWSVYLTPDKTGFVSGSADHTVKFWNFELVDDEENQTK